MSDGLTTPADWAEKKGLAEAKPFLSRILVPVNGIELLTFALRMRCSTN